MKAEVLPSGLRFSSVPADIWSVGGTHIRWSGVLLAFGLLALGGCKADSGAASTHELQSAVVEALVDADLQAAGTLYLDGNRFLAECRERVPKEAQHAFERKLASGRRRFERAFGACSARLKGELKVVKRRGGKKRRQAPGCTEQVWEYEDIELDVRASGRRTTVVIDGIVGIDGRYYIVERIHCR